MTGFTCSWQSRTIMSRGVALIHKSNESFIHVSNGFIGRVILSHSCAIAHRRAKKREFCE